jgi:hypothetical protein
MVSAGITPPAEKGGLGWFARPGFKDPIACAAIVLLAIPVVDIVATWHGVPTWEYVVVGVPTLVFPLWLVDTVRLPRWAWKQARRTKTLWVILPVLSFVAGGPAVLVFVPLYLFYVRRHVVRARQPDPSWPPPTPGTALAGVWPKFPRAWPKFEDQRRPPARAQPDVAEFGDYLNQGATTGTPRGGGESGTHSNG